MKKTICLVIALVMCLSIAAPAFAAENGFVPSITYKPNPEIVPVIGDDGEEYIGVIRDKDGNVLDYVGHGCILITPIAHVWDEEIVVPADVERLLTYVYEELTANRMTIPYEKHEADLNSANMVIRDLFDVRWACDEHPNMLEEEGVVFEIIFDLGIMAETEVYVMTYDEEADEWSPIVKAVNNGDGTLTCTFEHLCAIEFSQVVAATSAPTDDAPNANILPWIILLILALAAIVVVVIVKNKKKKAAV